MLLQLAEHALAYRHRTYEVETHKSACDAENDARRHTLHAPHAVEVEAEQRRAAHEDIREARSRDRCREDRQQRRHAQVDHQHFEREHQSGYGRLEDAGDGGGSTAANKQNQLLLVHAEQSSEVGTDSRTREHDRRLGTYRSAEADGDSRRHNRCPAVVPFQSRLLRGYSVEDARDTVRDVVLHHVAHEERR